MVPPTTAARVAGVGRGASPLARRQPSTALVSQDWSLLCEMLHWLSGIGRPPLIRCTGQLEWAGATVNDIALALSDCACLFVLRVTHVPVLDKSYKSKLN